MPRCKELKAIKATSEGSRLSLATRMATQESWTNHIKISKDSYSAIKMSSTSSNTQASAELASKRYPVDIATVVIATSRHQTSKWTSSNQTKNLQPLPTIPMSTIRSTQTQARQSRIGTRTTIWVALWRTLRIATELWISRPKISQIKIRSYWSFNRLKSPVAPQTLVGPSTRRAATRSCYKPKSTRERL